MKPLNVILKAFDGEFCKEILERAFRDIPVGLCISVMNHTKQQPDIRMKEHRWIPAKELMAGIYSGIDWEKIMPLDEELIENMRHCEMVFLDMVERYARYKDMPYEERRRQYYEHLRYWNHILETDKIGLYLANTIPHQCYDLVIYDLCRLKGIPVRYIERYYIVDAFAVEEDWRDAGKKLDVRMQELRKEYADERKEIPLSPAFEEYFSAFSAQSSDPWYMFHREDRLAKKSFVLKWASMALSYGVRKPLKFLVAVTSPSFWTRKYRQHKTALMYDAHTRVPDLNVPYIYVPLHLQPEATTCPMGGAYSSQELIVDLLAKTVPDGVRIYVKEHPAQGELARSEEFYRSLMEHPAVTLVPRTFSTFELTDHALAVATVTGTAAFESTFRGKPSLMFGHRFHQFAPGVFRIRTAQDCRTAIRSIMDGKGKPALRDARIFLRAIEDCTTVYVGGQDKSLTKEQKAQIMGEVIAGEIAPFFRN